jgi:hypothetical protein
MPSWTGVDKHLNISIKDRVRRLNCCQGGTALTSQRGSMLVEGRYHLNFQQVRNMFGLEHCWFILHSYTVQTWPRLTLLVKDAGKAQN